MRNGKKENGLDKSKKICTVWVGVGLDLSHYFICAMATGIRIINQNNIQ